MINKKKLVAAVLTCTMVASMTACTGTKGGNTDDIVDAADAFAKQVAALDGKKMLKLVEEIDEDKAEAIKNKLAMTDVEDDETAVMQAIASTITYEIDEDSAEINKDSASCDVVFTVVDYADAIGDLAGDADDFISAIEACDETKDYTVTIEFVQDDDAWLVAEDTLEDLNGVYSFLDYEFDFGAAGSDILDLVQRTSWWLSDNDNYENAEYIELDLWFTENPGVNVYYIVSKDGTDVYTSDVLSFSTSFFEAKYSSDEGAAMQGSYIAPGTYGIRIYAEEDDILLADETTTVTVSDTPATSGSTSGGSTSSTYNLIDGSFADIREIGWWDYGIEEADGSEHGTMAADGVYCSDSETIAFSIELNSEGPAIYYAYYFLPGENADASSVDYANPTYAQTIEVTAYQNGTMYYNIDYTPDTMAVGTYILIIAADESHVSSPYVTAACTVIPQTSAEFMNN